MYPSTIRLELISRRRQRRAMLIVSHAFVASVAFLSALSLVLSMAQA